MEDSLEETLLDYLKVNKFEEVEISLGCCKFPLNFQFLMSKMKVLLLKVHGVMILNFYTNKTKFLTKVLKN